MSADTGAAQQSGLTSAQAAELLKQYGPNVLENKRIGLLARVFKRVMSPMTAMFAAAGLLSFFSGHLEDAWIIAALFLVNTGVSIWQEAKADNAVAALREKLAVETKVLRDSAWHTVPAAELVPGDVVNIAGGDVVPADVQIVEPHNFSLNEAALTGESLPVEKKAKDSAYSGAFAMSGYSLAKVTATGSRTYFGKTLKLAEAPRRRSALEEDILSVSKFLSIASTVAIVILAGVLALEQQPLLEIATLGISMLIAGIPVALPTVMTLIISVGVVGLARKAVVVRRLSSLEDLADVTLLLSDKTGTLTQNKIVVERAVPLASNVAENELWNLALAASPKQDPYPLNKAIVEAARTHGAEELRVESFTPGDSERKRTSAAVEYSGAVRAVTLGAPQAVAALCDFSAEEKERFDQTVEEASSSGFRTLALALGKGEKEEHLQALAVFFIADELRADAKDTIAFMRERGIDVKMVTGDSYGVAAYVAKTLGIPGRVMRRKEYAENSNVLEQTKDIAGFAEVLPKDKFDIVSGVQNSSTHYITAVTGDGVNDVPAVKKANVGFAVQGSVAALRESADIVLTAGGISVVKDAIIEARKVFVRLYNYSVYRISESFRLIVTIAIIGAWFGAYPLTPVQIILIALLNDIPIVSLALDRVVTPSRPTKINARKRLSYSTLLGTIGILNSTLMLVVALYLLKLPWEVFQTMFFLKLTVSGHMLIYITHTEEKWFRFLPSAPVIWATTLTQLLATALALGGIFVTPISIGLVAFVWVWSFFWMQVSELGKYASQRFLAR